MSSIFSRVSFSFLVFVLGFSLSAVSFADQGAGEIQDQDEFINMVNAQFPGMVQPVSGQGSDPSPARPDDGLTWNEYLDQLDDLNSQLKNGEITEEQWMEQTQAARLEFLKGERARGRGLERERPRPVDVRGVQITNGQIAPVNPGQAQQEEP